MIVASLPIGPGFIWTAGWSVIVDAIGKRCPVLFDPAWDAADYPIDFPNDPLLTLVGSIQMLPLRSHLRSLVRNVAIAVPHERFVLPRYILNAKRHFDLLIAGSTWAAEMLIEAGFPQVTTIVHPPDHSVYKCSPALPHDDFIIFSGGKLELRKSQDIVIQAVAHMMQKYLDVRLILDWHNPWPKTSEGLYTTKVFESRLGQPLARIMRDAGIDLARVRPLPTQSSTPAEHTADKLEAMRGSDIGIFPNRAEATGNSFLIETMACGKPVIASYAHGHKDVLRADDPLLLRSMSELMLQDQSGQNAALWYEPSLDETIARLEWAYSHRDELPGIGAANARHIRTFTLDGMAEQYVAACQD